LVLTPEVESVNKAVDDEGEGNRAGPHYVAFAAGIGEGTQHIVYSKLPGPEAEVPAEVVRALRREPTLVIFVTRNANSSQWQLGYLRKLGRHVSGSTAVVMLASCGPYDLLDAKDLGYACVGSFEYTRAALEKAGAVILGRGRARGRVPVKV